MRELKRELYNHCNLLIDKRIAELQQLLKDYQSSANGETKSSAGDKYETGRAMMHLEKEKVSSQLNQVIMQKRVLAGITGDKISDRVGLGSLIQTDTDYFYLSISLGKVSLSEDVFCISPVSPIGKVLVGATENTEVSFQNRKYAILRVL